nr:MAG TPA: hypothetical protein [Caudoviricetes sp.]
MVHIIYSINRISRNYIIKYLSLQSDVLSLLM